MASLIAADTPVLGPEQVLARLLPKTAAGPDGCIIWTAATNQGYGAIHVGRANRRAYRVAYELMVGPVPAGLQLDHLCHTRDTSCTGGPECLHRRCVNPHHLQPVTGGENARRSPNTPVGRNIRRASCVNGHAFNEVNTYIRPDTGGRVCRRCRTDRMIAAYAAARAVRPPSGPSCDHRSRAGNLCSRRPGHLGKHQSRPGGGS
ncbi:hypothetical protein [Kitasatospora terrestris]|uniref:hypothetical protein n=1 Tax=Kitasatospora terrestris TaxID=258051 RepID=UPI0031E8F114